LSGIFETLKTAERQRTKFELERLVGNCVSTKDFSTGLLLEQTKDNF
jgi:hypothetical protein